LQTFNKKNYTMPNIDDLFKYLFKINSNERGRVFELYCKWFLENDPIYSAQLKKIWLWKDWPGSWGRDKGIDLIAETHTGELWAVQAKCYDESYYVTKEDVDKFLSESSRSMISYRLLICTTDRLGDNAREVIAAQEKQVGICFLENLLRSSLEWPTSVEDLKPQALRRPKTPRPHQKNAIASVLEGFKCHDKGQLYMACGTGKTLVGLWLAEQLHCQNTLVLVPSISLVSQLYQEWVANATTDFIPIFVCSDPTVNDRDQMVTSLFELGFPTTTDPKAILNYFSTTGGIPKVIFSTYHSSPVIKELCALDKQLSFDLIVADEAHRCAGAANSDFATIFETNAIRTHRKLFMTATPKIFSDHVKTKAQELEYDILSMDDEEKFGPVFYKLPFSTAITQDLLSDYEVLISIMDDKTFREYADKGRFVAFNQHESDARTIAAQLLISKAIKTYDLQRIITFHNRKSAASEFIDAFPLALNLISESQRPTVGFYGMILGDMLQNKRKSIMKMFENVDPGSSAILANVRCLSEGVDVPTLDGVAFIDPKGSEIEIVQAVGRAIRKAPNKKKGLIILPVFIDANEDPSINLEESCFKPIWKVLNALRAHDDILAEELDHLRLELGRRTYKKPPKLSKITIDLPVSIDSAFSDSLRLKILENTSASWLYYFGLLQNFKELHGHTNVPSTYEENSSLATWVIYQRVQYKKNRLSKERIQKLESLEFVWDPIDSAWEEMFLDLCKYKEQKGHCSVPQIYVENQKLANWVAVQRRNHTKDMLSKEQIAKLEAIGFIWDPNNTAWEKAFEELCKFQAETRHCIVPKEFPENLKMGAWVAKQRRLFNSNHLSKARIEKLESIGFIWHTKNNRWQKNLHRLGEFKKRTGHYNVLKENPQDLQFDSWMRTQRTSYRKGTLSQERIDALEAIGFPWELSSETEWEEMLLALCKYKAEHNDCMVPKKYPSNPKLASWVANQRQYYREGSLSKDKIARLETCGFVWEPFDSAWQEMFNALTAYKIEYGNCKVPAKYSKNPKLGGWVWRQRELHRKGLLPQEQFKMLDPLGFAWGNLKVVHWEKMFGQLCEYREKYSHCNVPGYGRHPENPQLSSWVANLRVAYKKKRLTQEQIQKIESIGFIWNIDETEWEEIFNQLILFKELNGHCNVSRDRKNYESLGRWIVHQREKYRKGKLSHDRIKRLESIGFVWGTKISLAEAPH
jgi:superfamily II DNA or RNA helicase